MSKSKDHTLLSNPKNLVKRTHVKISRRIAGFEFWDQDKKFRKRVGVKNQLFQIQEKFVKTKGDKSNTRKKW